MRSVDLYSFYIVYARLLESTGERLVSRDPANARDVPAGPLVAPQSAGRRSSQVGKFQGLLIPEFQAPSSQREPKGG